MRLLLALLIAATPSIGAVRAGTARVDITPPGPVWMSGYANRNHPSESVLQHLWARAVAIDTGAGGPIVIVGTDLIGLPFEVTGPVVEGAAQRFGLDHAHLLLNSSHTHTGPVVWPNLAGMFVLPPGDEAELKDYAAHLTGVLVTLIGSALADLKPATITFGFGKAEFAVNRASLRPMA